MSTDLVVLSLEGWDEVWRRNQHLVAGLLRDRPELRVLFVEPPADPWWDLAGRRRPRTGPGLRPVDGVPGVAPARLWTYRTTKLVPRRLDRRADDRIAARIRRAAAKVGISSPVLWINDPAGATVLATTGWPALYDVTDDWLAAQRGAAEHERLVANEEFLLREVEEVVVCSPALVRSKLTERPVTLIPNAVDVALYRTPRPRPAGLPGGPVAVYLGTVHTDRIDLDLAARTAEALRAVAGRLVLVGPTLLGQPDRLRLEAAGAVLLGPRPYTDVPAYLQHADVLVVPHLVTAFTDSLDPIKAYEYQAVGRPVVSTPVAGFREVDGVVTAAPEAFVPAVVRAATTPTPAVHRAVPTWAERVRQMSAVIDRLQYARPR